MLRINPDKALALPPVKYQIANVDQPLPANWLHLLAEELIKHLNLQMNSEKANIHHKLNEKAGDIATLSAASILIWIFAGTRKIHTMNASAKTVVVTHLKN